METSQVVFGVTLVVVLVAMAGYFAWRQGRTLQSLRDTPDMPAEERRYLRNQAWRRLVCSGLMVVLAILLAAHFSLEGPVNELVAKGEANRAAGEKRPLDANEKQFVDFYRNFWALVLLVLLAIICLAAVDYFAIRRFGKHQYRKIQADRRAMIEGELTRLRSQRNGHD